MNFKSTWRVSSLVRVLPVVAALALTACSSPEKRAEAHYESARELMQQGDYIRASLEFRNALKYNSKLVEAWDGLALAEEKKSDLGAAAGALKNVVELAPGNLDAKVRYARYLLLGGEVDQALTHINAVLEKKKDDPAVYALRAAALLRLNDREGARSDAEKALALDPDDIEALSVLAVDRLADGDTAGALQFTSRGLAADPKNLGLLLMKVRIHEAAKDDAKLEQALRAAIEAHPDLMELRKGLVSFLISRKKNTEAEEELRRMSAVKPDDAALAMELASFVGQLRGPDASRSEIEKLLASRPDSAVFRIALAKLDFQSGNFEKAYASLHEIFGKDEPKEDANSARLVLAAMRLQRKETAEASKLIEDVLAQDAKNAEALSLRAEMRVAANDTDGAIADIREALNQVPQSVPLRILLAKAHELQGAPELATEKLTEAVKLSGYSLETVQAFVSFLVNRNKPQQADAVLSDAVARNPDNAKLLEMQGQIKLRIGEYAAAEQIAEQLKKLDASSGTAGKILAGSLLGQKKYDEVITNLQANPDAGGGTMANLAQAYLRSNRIDEAEKFLSQAISANPNNAEALVLLGIVKEKQKDIAGAEALLRKAIELQPKSRAPYRALANLMTSGARPDEAEKVIRDGLANAGPDGQLSFSLAGLMERQGRIDEAIAVYDELVTKRPDALVAINNLASLLADHRTDAASIERAFQISRRLEGIAVPHYADTLGWIAYRRGDYETALKLFKDVAKQLPDVPLVHYHLGMTHAALKQNAEAAEQFKIAQKLMKDGDPLKEKVQKGIQSLVESE